MEDADAAIRDLLIAAIPPTSPPGLRDKLRIVLKYANQYSLRKRLDSLLNELGTDSRKKIAPFPPLFIEKIVNTRNYLTHYDPELRDTALSGIIPMYIAGLALRILLT